MIYLHRAVSAVCICHTLKLIYWQSCWPCRPRALSPEVDCLLVKSARVQVTKSLCLHFNWSLSSCFDFSRVQL